MKDRQSNPPKKTAFSRHHHFIGINASILCIMLAFVVSSCGSNLRVDANATSIAHASAALPAANYPVKVFFSQFPESVSTSASAVFPVDRSSPTLAIGTFALQLLIAGPTVSEQQAGYFTELNTLMSGPSNCALLAPVGGPDFTLTLDKKGSVVQVGTATMKFCRSLNSPGIGADARVTAEINATLKQFAAIKKVVILTDGGHCFGDMSGQDLCLK